MANEADIFFETSIPIPFICANATAIPYGTAVKVADPYTVSISGGAAEVVGGITAAEKIASDGVTTVPVWRSGIFKVYLSGSCTAGDAAVTADTATFPNFFARQTVSLSGNKIWGSFLETGTNGQTVLMELLPQVATGITL